MSRIALTLIAVALGFTASSSLAADSCPAPCLKLPTNSRYVSYYGSLPGGVTAPLVAGTLAKGKSKRAVAVEAAVYATQLGPGIPIILPLEVDVNGTSMEPYRYTEDCLAAPFFCTVSGTFWLDIDQNPSLIGVPLVVTLHSSNEAGGFIFDARASMSIRLEKK